jgi:hypothetical protein
VKIKKIIFFVLLLNLLPLHALSLSLQKRQRLSFILPSTMLQVGYSSKNKILEDIIEWERKVLKQGFYFMLSFTWELGKISPKYHYQQEEYIDSTSAFVPTSELFFSNLDIFDLDVLENYLWETEEVLFDDILSSDLLLLPINSEELLEKEEE